MKESKSVKKLSAVLLALSLLIGLCSCSFKTENAVVVNADVTTAVEAAAETTDAAVTPPPEKMTTQPESTTVTQPEPTTVQPEPTTRQSTRATEAAVTQARTQKEKSTEAPEITGVETVKDGGKTVVFPSAVKTSSKRWPVISWANGTGCPTWSYQALLEKLAGGGYIVVADEDVMSGDGTTQIDSIDYILAQNKNPDSVFYRKVNAAALGVCGHSQGGRSCINAAQKDARICCAVSIAGSSYEKEASSLRTPCLFLTGTADLVVLSSQWCQPSYDAVTGRAAYASLKGGIHTTCMTQPEKISGYTLAWFDAYLKQDAAAKKVFETNGRLAQDDAWQDFQCK